MTATAPVKCPRQCTPANPAPDAIRCPTPGCYRRRCTSPTTRGGLTATCRKCSSAAPRRAEPRGRVVGRADGGEYVLTADVPADVWPVAACREWSAEPPKWRLVAAGTRVTAVERVSRCDGGGDPVVELKCGGRFVCPPHAMELATATDATPARTR